MPKPLKEGRAHSSPRCRKASYEKISHKYGNSRTAYILFKTNKQNYSIIVYLTYRKR